MAIGAHSPALLGLPALLLLPTAPFRAFRSSAALLLRAHVTLGGPSALVDPRVAAPSSPAARELEPIHHESVQRKRMRT